MFRMPIYFPTNNSGRCHKVISINAHRHIQIYMLLYTYVCVSICTYIRILIRYARPYDHMHNCRHRQAIISSRFHTFRLRSRRTSVSVVCVTVQIIVAQRIKKYCRPASSSHSQIQIPSRSKTEVQLTHFRLCVFVYVACIFGRPSLARPGLIRRTHKHT